MIVIAPPRPTKETVKTSTRWIRNEADERAVREGCYFSEASANHCAAFFPRYLVLSTGEWVGKPFVLADWQYDDIIAPLFGWKRPDGFRRFRKAFIEIPKKNGKALGLSTPLPTPTGWTTMGEVQVGDQLFDDNGKVCRVVAATEVMMGRPCYEVAFSDGTTIVADAEHEWLTSARVDSPNIGGGGRARLVNSSTCTRMTRARTTKEIAETAYFGSQNIRNHSIRIASALELPEVLFLLDPYVLGAWLGDGTSSQASITSGDYDVKEMVLNLSAAGTDVVASKSKNKNAWRVGLFNPKLKNLCRRGHSRDENGKQCRACERARDRSSRAGRPVPPYLIVTVLEQLRELGLLNNKHIPPEYLRGSERQRMALLQGLMDTDGTCDRAGSCVFTTTSERLARDVRELVFSLGLKTYMRIKPAKLFGRVVGLKYNLQFVEYSDRPVFRLARKNARMKANPGKTTRARTRQIVSVRSVPSVPVRCVEVDSASHLYLAGETMVPTHNSQLASGVGLYMLVGDGEPGAEVYSTAYVKEQAKIVHREAVTMAEASPALRSILVINKSTNQIKMPSSNSFYSIMANDAGGAEGVKWHCLVADELHAWKGRAFWDSLKWGGIARRQPLIFVITTAGNDNLSVGKQEYDYCKTLLNGQSYAQDYFVYIREADPGDDPGDPITWRKANPSLGITIRESELKESYLAAVQKPTEMPAFKRYRLNLWQQSASPWISEQRWNACRRPYIAKDLEGLECCAGFDLGTSVDTTSLVLAFKMKDEPGEDNEKPVRLLAFFWYTDAAAAEAPDYIPYQLWAEQGHITLTEGDWLNQKIVRQDIKRIMERFRVTSFGYDPTRADLMAQMLIEDRPETEFVEFGQSYADYTEGTEAFETMVLEQRLHHDGNPILAHHVGNAVIDKRQNETKKPIKPNKDSPLKVDGAQSAVMALTLLLRAPPPREWRCEKL